MTKQIPADDDPLATMMAIRWYMLSIEKLSNDIYLTDAGRYAEVRAVLSTSFKALADIRKTLNASASATGCPPGYVECNGCCLPECENMMY